MTALKWADTTTTRYHNIRSCLIQINAASRCVTIPMKWSKSISLRWAVEPESEYLDEIRKVNVIPGNSGKECYLQLKV